MFATPEATDFPWPLGTGRQGLLLREVNERPTEQTPAQGVDYLHELLRGLLKTRNMSIRDLARRLHTTTTVVSRWASSDPQRRVVPSPRACRLLAQVLELEEDEVLVAAGHKSPTDGRPLHPHEAEIKRLTLALDFALRRIPLASFSTTIRIISGVLDSITRIADELTVEEELAKRTGKGRETDPGPRRE